MDGSAAQSIYRLEKERAMQERRLSHTLLMAEAKEAFAKLLADAQLARKGGRPHEPTAPGRANRPPVKPPVVVRRPLPPSAVQRRKPAAVEARRRASREEGGSPQGKARPDAKPGKARPCAEQGLSSEGPGKAPSRRRSRVSDVAPSRQPSSRSAARKAARPVMPSGQRVSRVLLALLAGLAVGIIVGVTGALGAEAAHAIAPLGTLWINAIRMTVVPLVVALLFTSVVGTDRTSEIGRETVVAFATFVGILFLAAGIAWLLAPGLIDDMRVTPETSAAMRATVSTTAGATRTQLDHLPGFRDWLAGLVPSNAIRAAVDGAMLPLIVFTALFAFGARQIAPDRRAALTTFFAAIADAMQVIVGWTIRRADRRLRLIAGPAAESGAQIAGAIGYYVVAISLLLFLFTLLLYPIAHFSGVHLARFSRGVLPAQAVALASSSSLASLPALMSGATDLRIPQRTSGFVLPLAVGVFKAATPISWTGWDSLHRQTLRRDTHAGRRALGRVHRRRGELQHSRRSAGVAVAVVRRAGECRCAC